MGDFNGNGRKCGKPAKVMWLDNGNVLTTCCKRHDTPKIQKGGTDMGLTRMVIVD